MRIAKSARGSFGTQNEFDKIPGFDRNDAGRELVYRLNKEKSKFH
jgi:hypothetical protein